MYLCLDALDGCYAADNHLWLLSYHLSSLMQSSSRHLWRVTHLMIFSVMIFSVMIFSARARGQSQSRRTSKLRRSHGLVTDSDDSPTLSECLYSASSCEECDVKEGCVWCAEPFSGLCLTQEWAKEMSFLPFLKCHNKASAVIDEESIDNEE